MLHEGYVDNAGAKTLSEGLYRNLDRVPTLVREFTAGHSFGTVADYLQLDRTTPAALSQTTGTDRIVVRDDER